MSGWVYHRYYPHVFLWHYVGAFIWLVCGKTFWSVQVYQSLFWLQLLLSMWVLARLVMPKNPWAICLSMVMLASLPMGQLFSVLLFQDVPATAQIVTAFLFLRRRQMFSSLILMGIAMSMKVTVFVVLPIYFLCMVLFFWRYESHWRTVLRLAVGMTIIIGLCIPMALTLKKMGWNYYPLSAVEQYLAQFGILKNAEQIWQRPIAGEDDVPVVPQQAQVPPVKVLEKPEICNHPGDLRIAQNWLIYFGGVFWGVVLAGMIGMALAFLKLGEEPRGETWPLMVGIWCLVVIAGHMRTAPDARFFLPAFPFIIMGISGFAVMFPGRRFWFPLVLVAAFLQSGVVLSKTISLRHISPAMREALDFLKKENKGHNYFMYPEGHERFIPGTTDWYLDRSLRDFWRANNDTRITMLAHFKMRYIVIKKHKIRDVDANTPDLGVYPEFFVEDIKRDSRFQKLFENSAVIIFLVPENAAKEGQQKAMGRLIN